MSHDPVIMEQVAMFMVALPCPPLPVLVDASKLVKQINGITNDNDNDNDNDKDEDCDHDDNRIVVSSHDLIAGLLICAMQRNNKARNEDRKRIQTALTEHFIDKIKDMGVKSDIKDTYTSDTIVGSFYLACMEFTSGYISSFDDPGNAPKQIQFLPMSDVQIGDAVHKACCAWNNGQNILFLKKWFKAEEQDKAEKEEQEKKIQDFKKQYLSMPYAKLMQAHCERVADLNCRASSIGRHDSLAAPKLETKH